MTLPGDPPAVRDRALLRALRSRGTFQFVLGAAALVFAVIAAVNGAAWWTVAIAAGAGVLVIGSGALAWRIAAGRMARLADAPDSSDAPDAAPATPPREPRDAAVPSSGDVSGSGAA